MVIFRLTISQIENLMVTEFNKALTKKYGWTQTWDGKFEGDSSVSSSVYHVFLGLLFAMEDLSSFWSKRLCWQTFFCSAISAAVASVFNQAFVGFQYQGNFGLFRLSVSLKTGHYLFIIYTLYEFLWHNMFGVNVIQVGLERVFFPFSWYFLSKFIMCYFRTLVWTLLLHNISSLLISPFLFMSTRI